MKKLFHISTYKLSEAAIDGIINISEQLKPEQASFDGQLLDYARRSELRWLPREEDIFKPLFEFVSLVFKEANQHFEVDVIENAFPLQYTTYQGSNKGHYDFHSDVHWPSRNNMDRKLSFIMQLSHPHEYTGGAFEFRDLPDFPAAEFLAKGSVLVFPSALFHRVTPVTSGTRRSLVSWIEGPCWR